MIARTQAFDTEVTCATGDMWLAATGSEGTFSPVLVGAGATATIHVTITPSGAAGTQVSGHLYVDDVTTDVPPYGQQSGDELTSIPYAYTIM
jgi:hypothetical protein